MTANAHQKVTASHLRRDAYLYVRQSTVRQVFENTEGTRRQYALRERAVAMGWPIERVIVIDSDLGDLPFSDLLSPGLEQGVHLDIRFVDSRFVDSDRDLPERPILDEYGLVAPLRSPSGVSRVT